MDYDCSISKRKGCNYCLRNKTINTNGDEFGIFKDDDGIYKLCTEGNHFLIMKSNYCPVCGRELNKH